MDDLMILVKVGDELPKVNKVLKTKSPITDVEYEVKVKKIKELRWTKTGDLVVVVDGIKL